MLTGLDAEAHVILLMHAHVQTCMLIGSDVRLDGAMPFCIALCSTLCFFLGALRAFRAIKGKKSVLHKVMHCRKTWIWLTQLHCNTAC